MSSTSPSAQLLREWFLATNWTPSHSYTQLTHQSRHLLDFATPPGLHLSLTNRSTALFASSLTLSALVPSSVTSFANTTSPTLRHTTTPLLAGQLTYVASSVELRRASTKRAAGGGEGVDLKELYEGFATGSVPLRPSLREGAEPTWQAGDRVDRPDYLLFGRLYAPSPRLDALYAHRMSPTLLSLISLVSVPSPPAPPTLSWQSEDPSAPGAAPPPPPPPSSRQSELEFKLLQDTGKWCGEYSYAVGDGMWGARGLYHFSPRTSSNPLPPPTSAFTPLAMVEDAPVEEEEEVISAGLRGRWSAGGEVFFSAKEPAAGMSAAVRFSTLPPEKSDYPQQPPTTMTATVNPIIGQISTAYAVETSPDSAMASRFDFNLYSYDAELTVGGEWFQRRKKALAFDETLDEEERPPLRPSFDAFGRGDYADPALLGEQSAASPASSGLPPSLSGTAPAKIVSNAEDEVKGVLKWRASTSADLALLWEGRLGDFLVSLGVSANLRSAGRVAKDGFRTGPITTVGVGLQYSA